MTTLNKTRLLRRARLPTPTTKMTRTPRQRPYPRTGSASSATRPLHLPPSADTTTCTSSLKIRSPQMACTMSTKSGRSGEVSPAGSRETVLRMLRRGGRRALRRWTTPIEVVDNHTMPTAQRTTHQQGRRSCHEKVAVEDHLSTCRAGNPQA